MTEQGERGDVACAGLPHRFIHKASKQVEMARKEDETRRLRLGDAKV
jgi:hypothetical protein